MEDKLSKLEEKFSKTYEIVDNCFSKLTVDEKISFKEKDKIFETTLDDLYLTSSKLLDEKNEHHLIEKNFSKNVMMIVGVVLIYWLISWLFDFSEIKNLTLYFFLGIYVVYRLVERNSYFTWNTIRKTTFESEIRLYTNKLKSLGISQHNFDDYIKLYIKYNSLFEKDGVSIYEENKESIHRYELLTTVYRNIMKLELMKQISSDDEFGGNDLKDSIRIFNFDYI